MWPAGPGSALCLRAMLGRDAGLSGIEGDAAFEFVWGTEMPKVSRVDTCDWQNDKHVSRAKLMIDDCAVAEERA